jgi:DNA-binding NarL/FixJ family response regulator
MAIRIVIADDHSVVRRGLRMFLAMDPELVVVVKPPMEKKRYTWRDCYFRISS